MTEIRSICADYANWERWAIRDFPAVTIVDLDLFVCARHFELRVGFGPAEIYSKLECGRSLNDRPGTGLDLHVIAECRGLTPNHVRVNRKVEQAILGKCPQERATSLQAKSSWDVS